MINIFRTHQRPLLIAFTVVSIVAFVFLYNPTKMQVTTNNDAGTIYGQSVKIFEIQQYQRKFELAYRLGMTAFLDTMVQFNELTREAGMERSSESSMESRAQIQFAWNSILVNHEAERLGIVPTEEEIADSVRALPLFATDGKYDPVKYQQFLVHFVSPSGFSEEHLFDVIRTQLRVERLKALISGPVELSTDEINADYMRSQQKVKLKAVLISFEEMKQKVVVTDEELQKEFSKVKDNLLKPATRDIAFVSFLMNDEQKKLTGAERAKVLKALYQSAKAFSLKMVEPGADFEKAAEAAGLKSVSTGEIEEGSSSDKLPKADGIFEKIAKLNTQDANSDVIQGPDGFYVLHLKSYVAGRPMTFDEAKADLQAGLSFVKAKEEAKKKADSVREVLEKELQGGKSFADAVKVTGLEVVDLQPISAGEPDRSNLVGLALRSILPSIKVGELSKVVPGMNGLVIGFAEERLPMDETKMKEATASFAPMLNENTKMRLFEEWLKNAKTQSGLQSRIR